MAHFNYKPLFILPFIAFLSIFYHVKVNGLIYKIDFNMTYMCGPYQGAEGRLFVRTYRGSGEFAIGITYETNILLDVVITREMNGHFEKTLYFDVVLERVEVFEVFFRTNCYVLNRVGECCAHDFKFTAEVNIGDKKTIKDGSWVDSNFAQKETSLSKCRNGAKRSEGRNCKFYFKSLYPYPLHVQPYNNRVDLRKLLLYPDAIKAEIKTANSKRPNDPLQMNYMTRRFCSPVHDKIYVDSGYFDKLLAYEKTIWPLKFGLVDNFYKDWTICAHPNYGLLKPSYVQGGTVDFNDDKLREKCPCFSTLGNWTKCGDSC